MLHRSGIERDLLELPKFALVAEAFLRIPLARLEEITRHYETLTSGGATGAPALAQVN